EIVYSAGFHGMNFQSERQRGLLRVSYISLGIRKSRVHKHPDCTGLGQQLMQQPKSLCSEFRLEKIHACDVAAWSIEVGNEAEPNRVAADREDDRRPEPDFSTERGDCPFITVMLRFTFERYWRAGGLQIQCLD